MDGQSQAATASAAAGVLLTEDDSNLLLQASQIASGLKERMRELERRETHLSEQLSALDQDQRNFRLQKQQTEEELAGRRGELQGAER